MLYPAHGRTDGRVGAAARLGPEASWNILHTVLVYSTGSTWSRRVPCTQVWCPAAEAAFGQCRTAARSSRRRTGKNEDHRAMSLSRSVASIQPICLSDLEPLRTRIMYTYYVCTRIYMYIYIRNISKLVGSYSTSFIN